MTRDNTQKGQAYHGKAGGDPEKPKRIPDSMVSLRRKEGPASSAEKKDIALLAAQSREGPFYQNLQKARRGKLRMIQGRQRRNPWKSNWKTRAAA